MSPGSPRPRPIHLVQLVHGYPPAVGGVEIATRDRCERLVAEHGFQVTVLTTDCYTIDGFRDRNEPRIPRQHHEVQKGVEVRRFSVRTRFAPALRLLARAAYHARLPRNDLLRTLYHGPICPGMLQAVRNLKPDVICAASFPLNHMRYPFLIHGSRPPVVLIGAVHTNEAWSFDRPNLLRLVNRSYATIAHTNAEREWLIERGADPGLVRVAGIGIDSDALRPRLGSFRAAHNIPDDGYFIAYFGQLGAHKGIDVLISALPALLTRCPNAWLVVAGSRTPFVPHLQQLILGLPPEARARIRLLMNLDDQTKADLLGDCDVFASPSQAESFGITTIEAWSLAKPVIVGDAPSQRSVVEDGITGLIIPHGSRQRLVAALERLADPALRARLGEAGRRVAGERYDRRRIDSMYAELFRSAVAATGRRTLA